jgi:ArsR family transcriptional regulator, arsenate/arsenite/antimonite-responsive transcriptional repressor
MGITKTELFSDHQNELAQLFKAIGHPARIAIIDYLLQVDSCICGDIVNEVQLAQPTISQHLKELKNAGIIKGSIEGTSICYCLDEKALQKVEQYCTSIKTQIQNKCC